MTVSFKEQLKAEGISLRFIHSVLIVVALIVSWFLIYSTFRLTETFLDVTEATDQYIEMHKAASEMMDAADYLVEMVQRYTLDGNSVYLHNYFDEAFAARRREDAIEKMSVYDEEKAAVEKLRKAMEASQELAEIDYYAMKLVIEATGYSPAPEQLRDIELRPEHAHLSAWEKKAAAQHMVSDEDYYRRLDRIRADMRQSLSKLEERTRSVQLKSTADMRRDLRGVRTVTIMQAIAIILMTWATVRLGVSPILKAVDKIREDSPIPVTGANEFRYLAQAYNRMYEVYKSSVASLSYKASHDELTKVYNRAGYDVLLSGVDLRTTSLVLLDLDRFKDVNDTYGHEVGDRILCKVAAVVGKHFRNNDCVCRIGGDEFVTIMLHSGRAHQELIAGKVEQINTELRDTADGLPQISVSAGVAFGEEAATTQQLFEHADAALYETKRRGRKGVSFYHAPDL